VKIVFTLGNLIQRKGFNYLIDAMEQICNQRDDVLCFIGGAGPERGSLQGQIDRLHLGEKVKLLGSVPSEILLTLWMNACDFFVLPSLSKVLDGSCSRPSACGKPFVGTKGRGVPEVIASDDYGLLVEPADPEDLAEKILVALDREWDREAILEYASGIRGRISRRRSWVCTPGCRMGLNFLDYWENPWLRCISSICEGLNCHS
jgi:teichuronic acid biosynthesis glycosyltransferase TuaC